MNTIHQLKVKDSFAVEAGSGPRHLTFKKGRYVYVLQELTGGLMVFSYSKGKLRKIDQTTILANGFKGTFTGADIHFLTENFICLKPWGSEYDFNL
jgi:6-phosphogluconolactonase